MNAKLVHTLVQDGATPAEALRWNPDRPSARSLGRGRSLLARMLRREFRRDTPAASTLTIRLAEPADRDDLQLLAEIDERPVPDGAALVLELDDEIVAAVPLETGEAIVHPLKARHDLVFLLEVRAAQLAA
jgi:hypothetical protein